MIEYGCRVLAMLLFATVAISSPADAQMLSGAATATDGDSLVVGSQRVRLFGIDAPELDQTCVTDSKAWQCGADAKQQLHELVAGQRVDCQITGTDQYGRTLGRCSTEFLQLDTSKNRPFSA